MAQIFEIHCEAGEIADLHSVINSQVLFFKTGGRVRMALKKGIPFLEPLYYAIAWWWSGYFTDNTTT
jgi:hypothetical protein